MQIYIVVSGEYSDYRIEATFSDVEKAKTFCRLRNNLAEDGYGEFDDGKGWTYTPDYRIEEYELDQESSSPPSIAKGYCGYEVRMSKDGEASFAKQVPILSALGSCRAIVFSQKEPLLLKVGSNCNADLVRVKSGDHLRAYVLAKDEKHAVKIVAEKRAQIVALNRWPDEYDKPGGVAIQREEKESTEDENV